MSCRFVIISDTHFIEYPAEFESSWWNRSTHRFSREMGDALVELVNNLSPDFAVHCGDFTGWDSRENFNFGAGFMELLGCPWYGIPGNHDTWFSETRNGFHDIFECGEKTWSYARDLGGMKFFFLDVVHWYESDGKCSPMFDREKYNASSIIGMGPSERDLFWLNRELKQSSKPSVIVSHAPIAFKKTYPLKTLPNGKPVNGPVTPPSAFINDIIHREKLFGITQNIPVVKACIAGHWHINDAVTFGGILYMMTGALREFPYEIRLVEYDGETFYVSTHELDVPKLRKISYVEKWGNKWVKGNDDIRKFVFTFA